MAVVMAVPAVPMVVMIMTVTDIDHNLRASHRYHWSKK
jgi:hypothetical protein